MVSKLGRKLLISLIASSFLLSLLAFEGTKANVTLVLDGKEEKVRTHAGTIGELLKNQNIEIEEYDKVEPSLETEITNKMTVSWTPAKKVVITMNDGEKTIWTTGNTVQDVIKNHNLDINEYDKVSPSEGTEISHGMTINVHEAFSIVLKDGGEKEEVWTTSTTVADFLKQQEIELDEFDRVKPDLSEKIKEDTVVDVIRVEKVTDVVEEPVDYAVVTRKDSSLTAGNERVIESGEKGLVKNHYEVVLENGKEKSRKLIKSEQIKESKDQIVAVGTKQLDAQVARGSGTVAKEMYVKATAYTAYCDGCSGITRTGINLRKNPHLKVIAVDPNVIPLGTKVWVEGYGYAIAGDTGGAIKGNKIDLFIPDKNKVYEFGVQTVKIKILE